MMEVMSKQHDFAGKAPAVFQYMPPGVSVICASVNGKPGKRKVTVDASTAERLQRDLEDKLAAADAGKKARPCGLFDHADGKASLLPKKFTWDEERGVMLEAEWTDAGKAAVEGRDYSYWSPSFRLNKAGQVVGLQSGVEVGSLVNNPAFESIERIAAGKQDVDEPGEDEVDVNGGGEESAEADKVDAKAIKAMSLAELRKAVETEKNPETKDAYRARINELEQVAVHEAAKYQNTIERCDSELQYCTDVEKCKELVEKRKAAKEKLAELDPAKAEIYGDIDAANPYGCNQYGHGSDCPQYQGSSKIGSDPDMDRKYKEAGRRILDASDKVEKAKTEAARKKAQKEYEKALADYGKLVRETKSYWLGEDDGGEKVKSSNKQKYTMSATLNRLISQVKAARAGDAEVDAAVAAMPERIAEEVESVNAAGCGCHDREDKRKAEELKAELDRLKAALEDEEDDDKKKVLQKRIAEIEGANPYGCNQYGHSFKSYHRGFSSPRNIAKKKRAKENATNKLNELARRRRK